MTKTNYVDLVKKQNREFASSYDVEVVVYFKDKQPSIDDLKKVSLGLNFVLKPGGKWISKPYLLATTSESNTTRLIQMQKQLLKVDNVAGVDLFRDHGEQMLTKSGKWADF